LRAYEIFHRLEEKITLNALSWDILIMPMTQSRFDHIALKCEFNGSHFDHLDLSKMNESSGVEKNM
jgi:hypothetical protein